MAKPTFIEVPCGYGDVTDRHKRVRVFQKKRQLAVTRHVNHRARFSVTHLPTGYSILPHQLTSAQAKEVLREFAKLPWPTVKDPAKLPKRLRSAGKAILRRLYERWGIPVASDARLTDSESGKAIGSAENERT